jgi:hypothetical protein
MKVSTHGFRELKEALGALRDLEYREFLREVGCPPEKIHGEVENLRHLRK